MKLWAIKMLFVWRWRLKYWPWSAFLAVWRAKPVAAFSFDDCVCTYECCPGEGSCGIVRGPVIAEKDRGIVTIMNTRDGMRYSVHRSWIKKEPAP